MKRWFTKFHMLSIYVKVHAFCFSICMMFSTFSYCQPNNTSSLPANYLKLNTDTARMRFLSQSIADSLDEGQLDYVMQWSHTGLAIAEKNNVDTMKGIFLFDIGKAFTYKYNLYDSAIYYYKKALPFFPERRHKYYIHTTREIMDRYSDLGNRDSALAYVDRLNSIIDSLKGMQQLKTRLFQSIALIYQGFSMNRVAIRYYNLAISNGRESKNYRGLGMALANLGELYNQTGNTEKAIQTSKEAMVYLHDVNMPYMQAAGNVAEYYITQKKYDSALVYLNKSDERAKKINDFETAIVNKNRLALIYIAQGKFAEAKQLLDKNIALLSGTQNDWNKCITYIDYAILDTAAGRFENAKSHLEQAATLAVKNNFSAFTVPAFENLSTVYKRLGDYKKSLEYHTKYVMMKDSLADEKTKAELADLDISYQTLQKEKEIELLKKDNDIKKLQLSNSKRSMFLYLSLFVFVIVLLSIIYYQRNRRSKIETEKLRAELQAQVLRSQMNPHFIFNCLNSIENFIMQNDKRQASDYLNKFSLLIRSILDSSRNEVVPITKDMEALRLYVDLEQLRFNNKFTFEAHIDPALAGGDYLVPSLLIQPFVENAIVHGMAHSDEKNLNLIVTASLEGDNIKYTIQDNGVGREKAKVYNMQNKPYHKSVGLKITEERVNMFNRQQASDAIRITDLYDENKNPDGTKVEITLKAV